MAITRLHFKSCTNIIRETDRKEQEEDEEEAEERETETTKCSAMTKKNRQLSNQNLSGDIRWPWKRKRPIEQFEEEEEDGESDQDDNDDSEQSSLVKYSNFCTGRKILQQSDSQSVRNRVREKFSSRMRSTSNLRSTNNAKFISKPRLTSTTMNETSPGRLAGLALFVLVSALILLIPFISSQQVVPLQSNVAQKQEQQQLRFLTVKNKNSELPLVSVPVSATNQLKQGDQLAAGEHELLLQLLQSTGSLSEANQLLEALIGGSSLASAQNSDQVQERAPKANTDYSQVKPSLASPFDEQSPIKLFLPEPLADAAELELVKTNSNQPKSSANKNNKTSSAGLLEEIIEAGGKGFSQANYNVHYDDESSPVNNLSLPIETQHVLKLLQSSRQIENLLDQRIRSGAPEATPTILPISYAPITSHSDIVGSGSSTSSRLRAKADDSDGLNNNESISSLIIRDPTKKLIANYSHWINHEAPSAMSSILRSSQLINAIRSMEPPAALSTTKFPDSQAEPQSNYDHTPANYQFARASGQKSNKRIVNNWNDEKQTRMSLVKKNETGIHKIVFLNSMPGQWTPSRTSNAAIGSKATTSIKDGLQLAEATTTTPGRLPPIRTTSQPFVEVSVMAETFPPTATTAQPTTIKSAFELDSININGTTLGGQPQQYSIEFYEAATTTKRRRIAAPSSASAISSTTTYRPTTSYSVQPQKITPSQVQQQQQQSTKKKLKIKSKKKNKKSAKSSGVSPASTTASFATSTPLSTETKPDQLSFSHMFLGTSSAFTPDIMPKLTTKSDSLSFGPKVELNLPTTVAPVISHDSTTQISLMQLDVARPPASVDNKWLAVELSSPEAVSAAATVTDATTTRRPSHSIRAKKRTNNNNSSMKRANSSSTVDQSNFLRLHNGRNPSNSIVASTEQTDQLTMNGRLIKENKPKANKAGGKNSQRVKNSQQQQSIRRSTVLTTTSTSTTTSTTNPLLESQLDSTDYSQPQLIMPPALEPTTVSTIVEPLPTTVALKTTLRPQTEATTAQPASLEHQTTPSSYLPSESITAIRPSNFDGAAYQQAEVQVTTVGQEEAELSSTMVPSLKGSQTWGKRLGNQESLRYTPAATTTTPTQLRYLLAPSTSTSDGSGRELHLSGGRSSSRQANHEQSNLSLNLNDQIGPSFDINQVNASNANGDAHLRLSEGDPPAASIRKPAVKLNRLLATSTTDSSPANDQSPVSSSPLLLEPTEPTILETIPASDGDNGQQKLDKLVYMEPALESPIRKLAAFVKQQNTEQTTTEPNPPTTTQQPLLWYKNDPLPSILFHNRLSSLFQYKMANRTTPRPPTTVDEVKTSSLVYPWFEYRVRDSSLPKINEQQAPNSTLHQKIKADGFDINSTTATASKVLEPLLQLNGGKPKRLVLNAIDNNGHSKQATEELKSVDISRPINVATGDELNSSSLGLPALTEDRKFNNMGFYANFYSNNGSSMANSRQYGIELSAEQKPASNNSNPSFRLRRRENKQKAITANRSPFNSTTTSTSTTTTKEPYLMSSGGQQHIQPFRHKDHAKELNLEANVQSQEGQRFNRPTSEEDSSLGAAKKEADNKSESIVGGDKFSALNGQQQKHAMVAPSSSSTESNDPEKVILLNEEGSSMLNNELKSSPNLNKPTLNMYLRPTAVVERKQTDYWKHVDVNINDEQQASSNSSTINDSVRRKRRREPPVLPSLAADDSISRLPIEPEKSENSSKISLGNLFARLPATVEAIATTNQDANLDDLLRKTPAQAAEVPQQKKRRELINYDPKPEEQKETKTLVEQVDQLQAGSESQNSKSSSLSPLVDEYRTRSLIKTMINLGVPTASSSYTDQQTLSQRPFQNKSILSNEQQQIRLIKIDKHMNRKAPLGQASMSPMATTSLPVMSSSLPTTTITTTNEPTTKAAQPATVTQSRWRINGEPLLKPVSSTTSTTTHNPIQFSTSESSPTAVITTQESYQQQIFGSQNQPIRVVLSSSSATKTVSSQDQPNNDSVITTTQASAPTTTNGDVFAQIASGPTSTILQLDEGESRVTSTLADKSTTFRPKSSQENSQPNGESSINTYRPPILSEESTGSDSQRESSTKVFLNDRPLLNQLRNQRHSSKPSNGLIGHNNGTSRPFDEQQTNTHVLLAAHERSNYISSFQRMALLTIGLSCTMVIVLLLVIAIFIKCKSAYRHRHHRGQGATMEEARLRQAANRIVPRGVLERKKVGKRVASRKCRSGKTDEKRLARSQSKGNHLNLNHSQYKISKANRNKMGGSNHLLLATGSEFSLSDANGNHICLTSSTEASSASESTTSIGLSNSNERLNFIDLQHKQHQQRNQRLMKSNYQEALYQQPAARLAQSSKAYMQQTMLAGETPTSYQPQHQQGGASLRQRISGTITSRLLKMHLPRLLPYFAFDYANETQQQAAAMAAYQQQQYLANMQQSNQQQQMTLGDLVKIANGKPPSKVRSKAPKPAAAEPYKSKTFGAGKEPSKPARSHHQKSESKQQAVNLPGKRKSGDKIVCQCQNCSNKAWSTVAGSSSHTAKTGSESSNQQCLNNPYNLVHRSKLPFGTASSVLRHNEPANEIYSQQQQLNHLGGQTAANKYQLRQQHRISASNNSGLDNQSDCVSVQQSQMDNEHHLLIDNQIVGDQHRHNQQRVSASLAHQRIYSDTNYHAKAVMNRIIHDEREETNAADENRETFDGHNHQQQQQYGKHGPAEIAEANNFVQASDSCESDNYYNLDTATNYGDGHPTFQVHEEDGQALGRIVRHGENNFQQKQQASSSNDHHSHIHQQSVAANLKHQPSRSSSTSTCNCNLVLYPI